MSEATPVEKALALLDAERSGVLSTLSKKLEGWPFGSIAPYALSRSSEPLILISDIAEHTRNLRADARASLLVQDTLAIDDPQAGARATLMGYAMPVPSPYLEDAWSRYTGSFPNSPDYLGAHDFSMFELKVTRVRFIGGFGEIYWLEGPDFVDPVAAADLDPLAESIRSTCDHMNQDHRDALVLFAKVLAGIEGDEARMIHLDSEGFDMVLVTEGSHKHIRIDFPEPVMTAEQVRTAMIDMIRRCRGIERG
jgi:putative heme iron utilization protein